MLMWTCLCLALHTSREIEQTTSYLWPFFSSYYYLHSSPSLVNKSAHFLRYIYMYYWIEWLARYDMALEIFIDRWANLSLSCIAETIREGYWHIWSFVQLALLVDDQHLHQQQQQRKHDREIVNYKLFHGYNTWVCIITIPIGISR